MSNRRSILSYPGVMQHAQQIARALHEAGELEAFVTSFVFRDGSPMGKALQAIPGSHVHRLLRQLRRRSVVEIPSALVHGHPLWEMVRSALAQFGAGARTVDWAWDLMAHRFDAMVANQYVPHVDVIHAFEYTALASFKRAAQEGVSRVLHLPSLDSKSFEEIRRREQAEWPELADPNDRYFAGKFARRYERRLQEIARADLIIANSSLTKRSHVHAGADPNKIVVVPLGAPPPVASLAVGVERPDVDRFLTVVWAGSFKLGKGAHYFLESWRRLAAGPAARTWVFGAVDLPQRMLVDLPAGIEFRGSVAQPELFAAYDASDVLVFPTLSDGFGMVVTEALSRGLPVITTDQAGAADLIEHGRNGLIIPAADPEALKNAFEWCLDNRERLSGMRQAALATAVRHQWADFRESLRTALERGLPERLERTHAV